MKRNLTREAFLGSILHGFLFVSREKKTMNVNILTNQVGFQKMLHKVYIVIQILCLSEIIEIYPKMTY